jgi:rubrerythrin
MIFSFNALEVFQIAISIEENGRVFYEKAQAVVDDAEVKELFKDLGLQEVEHRKKFETLKAQLPAPAAEPTVWDPDNEAERYLKMMADEHIFGPGSDPGAMVGNIQNASDALKAAMGFEKDSIIFFLTMKDATDELKGREYIDQLVKEEQEHLRRLALQLRKRTKA